MSALSNPNTLPPYATLPELPLDEDGRAELTGQIWDQLITGRGDADDFIDIYSEDYDLTDEQLGAAFDALRTARLRQQAEIGAYTSRTIAAFEELNANGVLARADFSCCGTCASGEIWGERDDSRHWKGYAYFHQQDTDKLVEDGETYIGYGAFPPEDFDEAVYDALSDDEKEVLYTADVTRLLDDVMFPVLRRHGIEPEWDRDLGTRVLLKNADWYDPIEA
ncbi:DUF6891 domain-containing protein [Rhodococcus tukisamuensis]|uniref:DUF6891 domain-containing protein n=1 Tax=Rhodococcus tukisamuensis TaxID=168276 RepID=A0A1G6UIA4_9NOCA|nr:hypothetical protein [Rhodococcus tukisamuensis]SDD40456.1 hypothetical protein SAMN05444580_104185 [Rhodococcus tukisamuensis]